MSMEIRFPNITASTDTGKLQQMQSYLFQLVEQLNFAMKSVETAASSNVVMETGRSTGSDREQEVQASFNSIKALIIKSADIVNAYYEEISQKLSGEYVAQSEFGTYRETTEQTITKTSTMVEQNFRSVQQIITDLEGLQHKLIEVDAHINSGMLYYDDDGVPVYGLEIGQRTEIDGVEVFNKYARFTSEKLSFFSLYMFTGKFKMTEPPNLAIVFSLICAHYRYGNIKPYIVHKICGSSANCAQFQRVFNT